ncbi:MAG: hypothetical protein QOK14_188 [Frankiaceae bacterium]|nr:hypothetical protein [Frankiaceae bacterium]
MLSSAGISVALRPGWDVRIKHQEPSVPGSRRNALLHAATVPLPTDRGDYGSGVVDHLGPDDAFVALFEYDPEAAAEPLFEAVGLPVPSAAEFSPTAMQRPAGGRSGGQWFFHTAGRAFCVHIVLGSHARRVVSARRVAALLRGISIGPTS